MTQVKIYGLKKNLKPIRPKLSAIIHDCLMEAFALPPEKKFQRFIYLAEEDFIFPSDRTKNYTILEFSIFQGRSKEAKKKLITQLFAKTQKELNLSENDLEITIFETPKNNWGIRGLSGDELNLSYKVDV